MRPSQVVVLSVHRGLRAGAVRWQAVVVVVVVGTVVVLVVVVVVVFGQEVVVLVVVLVVVAAVVVVELLVVLVLRACPQDPLALRWNMGVGNHLQPLGLQALVNSVGGFRARFDGDRRPGVQRPRVGLLGNVGRLWGPDGGAFGDGAVDEDFDGVVLRGCLRGCGSCSG